MICETRSRMAAIENSPNAMKPRTTRRMNKEVVSKLEGVHSIQESRE